MKYIKNNYPLKKIKYISFKKKKKNKKNNPFQKHKNYKKMIYK